MPMQKVEFQFITGLKRAIFRNPRLRGSWDSNGRYSDNWTESPMQEEIGEDGCPIFKASISLDLADQERTFKWGVALDGPQGSNFWGIPAEVPDVNSVERYRQFRLNRGEARLKSNATTSLTGVTWGRISTLRQEAPQPACVLPFGHPTRKMCKWSSESRPMAILPMTAPGSIPRSRWSIFPARLTAFGKAGRREILKLSKAYLICIAS